MWWIYIFVMTACAAGLWGLLRVGSRLQAPPDLSGNWRITTPQTPDASTAPSGTDPGDLGRTLQVEQSGRFLRFRFEGGRVMDLKLIDPVPPRDANPAVVHLSGASWRLTGRLERGSDSLFVLMDGSSRYSFSAQREAAPSAPRGRRHSSPTPATGHAP